MFFISSVFYPQGSSLWLCYFSLENKNLVVFFFFPWKSVSLKSRLLLRIMLLFLLGSGISLAYSPLFFFPAEAPEETVHYLFSACHWLGWFFSLSSEGYQSASEPLSYAAGSSVAPEGPWALGLSSCFLLARDLTRQETARHTSVCPCKLFKKKFNPGLISCDFAVSELRIHQNITHFCTLGYDTME